MNGITQFNNYQYRSEKQKQIVNFNQLLYMFSSATDRFFHGMNKRHTQMIDTTALKACLQLSRNQRQNTSKSKTSRMFSRTNNTLRSTSNTTLQSTSRTFSQKNQNQTFAPPLPFNQNQGQLFYLKRKTKFKLNMQANCPDSSQLHSLIQKHINKQEKEQNYQSQYQVTDQKEDHKQKYIRSTFCLKDKLRKKVQQNALKKFSNSKVIQNKNNTERVSFQVTKNLQIILNKDKAKTQFNQRAEAFENENFYKFNNNHKEINILNEKNKLQEIHKKQKQIKRPVEKQEESKQLVKKEIKIQGPAPKTMKQCLVKQISSTSDTTQNKQKQFKNKDKNNIKTIEQPSKPQNQIKTKIPNVKEKNISTQKTKQKTQKDIYQSKQPISKKTIKQIKQNQNVKPQIENKVNTYNKIEDADKKNKKPNTFWNTQIQSNFLNEHLDLGIKKNNDNMVKTVVKKQEIVPPKNQILKSKNTDNNNNYNKEQNKKQPKTNLNDFDQLQQITIPQTKQIKEQKKVQDKKPVKTEKVVKNQVALPLQSNKPKNTTQLLIQKKTSTVAQQPKNKKQIQQKQYQNNTKIIQKKQQKKKLNIQQIMTTIQNILYMVSQFGSYGNNLKQFYQKTNIQNFAKQSKILAYYLWQHFYYLRQKCIKILTNKNQNFFTIQQKILNIQQIEQFIQQQITQMQDQNNSTIQRIKKLHEICKQNLLQQQKILTLNNQQNYYDKCIKLLQKQFIEIQKLYRKAIKNSDTKQNLYIQKLCEIIEIVCLLKYFNGEFIKQFEEAQEIENLSQHYQFYKHLVVL